MTSYRPPLFEAATSFCVPPSDPPVSAPDREEQDRQPSPTSWSGDPRETVPAAPAAAAKCDSNGGTPTPTPPSPPLITWDTAQAILYVVQERVSAAIGRQVEFDEGHVAFLQTLFLRDAMAFWTVVDQVHERMLCADWANVRDDGGFIHSLVTKVRPIPCEIPESEFVQMLLAKLWPPEQPSQRSPVCPDMTVAAGESGGPEQQRMAHEQMISMAVGNVYTWQAALKMLEMIGERLTKMVGRHVGFDDKHRTHLRAKYDEDPLGFWSVLDQVQDRMTEADWDGVRNDARFIQSFINKFEPVDVPLSEFLAASIPQHSLVPYGYPPHVLRSRTFAPVAAAAMAAAASGASSKNPSSSSPLLPPLSSPQKRPPPLLVTAADPNYPFTWKAGQAALEGIEEKILKSCGREVKFDEKHRVHLRHRWEQDPKGFFSVLDQIQERLVLSDWFSIRDTGRYIQSLLSRFEPLPALSKFMQTFVTPASDQAAPGGPTPSDPSASYPDVTWDDVVTFVFPAIKERASRAVGKVVMFDEKHKIHLKQRFDRDSTAFWSILDQVQERMSLSDWSTVRDDGRFIQSFITKAEPQMPLELGEFLRSVLSSVPSSHRHSK